MFALGTYRALVTSLATSYSDVVHPHDRHLAEMNVASQTDAR